MADWHYTSGGRQHGPVSEDQLKSLVASGTIRPSDLVWNPSMPQWVPAGQAGVLGAAMAAAPMPGYSAVATPTVGSAVEASAPYAALAYEGPNAEAIAFTHQSMEMLRQTRPWALFIAIIFFIIGGLLGGGGVVMTFAMSFANRNGPKILSWIGLVYLAIALFYVIPAVCMVRFSSRINQLTRMRRISDLEGALAAMKSVFRVSGILLIVGITLYFVGIAIFMAIGMR